MVEAVTQSLQTERRQNTAGIQQFVRNSSLWQGVSYVDKEWLWIFRLQMKFIPRIQVESKPNFCEEN